MAALTPASLDSYLLTSPPALHSRYALPPSESFVSLAHTPPASAVQHPAKAMGDDGLLLKYLNPHLAVLLTAVSEPEGGEFVAGGREGGPRGVEEKEKKREEVTM
jgi:hypothetical protein